MFYLHFSFINDLSYALSFLFLALHTSTYDHLHFVLTLDLRSQIPVSHSAAVLCFFLYKLSSVLEVTEHSS